MPTHDLLKPEELVRRAIANARPYGPVGHPRWSCLTVTFAIGSTMARDLCRHYGFDPDALVQGYPCAGCDR